MTDDGADVRPLTKGESANEVVEESSTIDTGYVSEDPIESDLGPV
jgi:hypothetical protein